MSILKERAKTHGDYERLAFVAQSLKNVLRDAPNYERLSPVQRESVELIATKLARIVCGDPDEKDHWIDLSGYADLVNFNLNNKKTASRAKSTVMEMDPDEETEICDCCGGAVGHLSWCPLSKRP